MSASGFPILIQEGLRPVYYDKFHCLAEGCRLSCCKGWSITFNKKDYLALRRQSGSPELMERLTGLRRVRDPNAAENRYGEFTMEGGTCALLREDCLCALQAERGPDALPEVCRNFPRTWAYQPSGYLERSLTPAILAYEGLQYQHMAPVVFTEDALCYAQEHLRILSGFYGVLRPLDGIVPYRLEMQAALSVDGKKDLYEFWGGTLYEALQEGNADGMIGNLASKEYARAVEPYRKPGDLFLTVVFAERCDGKLRQKGTCAKMARGEMVRFLAETRASSPEAMKDFSALDYRYQESCSDGDTWVFVREETGK